MTNLFKVRINKKSDDFENLFQKAYQDIYALAKKVCSSRKAVVKDYLSGIEDPWITLGKNSITFEVDGYTTICENDAHECTQNRSGYFNITTKEETVQGINYKCCTLLSRNDGYGYEFQKRTT